MLQESFKFKEIYQDQVLDHHYIEGTQMSDIKPLMSIQYFNHRETWLLGVLYALTLCLSVILNIATLTVLIKGRRTELRLYLCNLAISDLFLALFSARKYLSMRDKNIKFRDQNQKVKS